MNPLRRFRDAIGKHGWSGTLEMAARLATGPIMRPLHRWWVTRYLRVTGQDFDHRFKVDTCGWIDGKNLDASENVQHATAYAGVVPEPFHTVMDQLKIAFEQFVFVDFGSGKGRALMLATEYPFASIVGVEFSPQLHACAESNIRVYCNSEQKCRNIELQCMDATRYEIPERPAVLFFFNPFDESIMRPIAARVAASLRKLPRPLYIVYFWPTARKLWDETDELVPVSVRQPTWAWPAHRGRDIVAVWASRSIGPTATSR